MSRAEGRSLVAVAATNLFQVVAAWKSGERWKKDLFGRWTRMERGLVRLDIQALKQTIVRVILNFKYTRKSSLPEIEMK